MSSTQINSNESWIHEVTSQVVTTPEGQAVSQVSKIKSVAEVREKGKRRAAKALFPYLLK